MANIFITSYKRTCSNNGSLKVTKGGLSVHLLCRVQTTLAKSDGTLQLPCCVTHFFCLRCCGCMQAAPLSQTSTKIHGGQTLTADIQSDASQSTVSSSSYMITSHGVIPNLDWFESFSRNTSAGASFFNPTSFFHLRNLLTHVHFVLFCKWMRATCCEWLRMARTDKDQ